jgi:hypothetical protein
LNSVLAESVGIGPNELSNEWHGLGHEELDELDTRLAETRGPLGAVGLPDEQVDDSDNVFLGFENSGQLDDALCTGFTCDSFGALCKINFIIRMREMN